MFLFWSILLLVSILFLTVSYYNQIVFDKNQKKEVIIAENALKTAEKYYKSIDKDIFNAILKSHGEEIAKKIINRKISIGMPEEFVLIAWGEPSEIKYTLEKNVTSKKLYYAPYYNQENNLKYKREVTIVDNLMINCKDLNSLPSD